MLAPAKQVTCVKCGEAPAQSKLPEYFFHLPPTKTNMWILYHILIHI